MLADYRWTLAKDAPTVEYKRQAKRKKVTLFVLNNERTWKRAFRCSIYAVQIISKQNKTTKQIPFHWIVFSFLFNPPFRTLFQPTS